MTPAPFAASSYPDSTATAAETTATATEPVVVEVEVAVEEEEEEGAAVEEVEEVEVEVAWRGMCRGTRSTLTRVLLDVRRTVRDA